jgi:signal peptide peptidase SppA
MRLFVYLKHSIMPRDINSQRFIDFSRPWMIEERSARQYLAIYNDILIRRASEGKLTPSRKAQIESEVGEPLDNEKMWDVRDGVARIQISGPLIKRGDWMDDLSGVSSYEGIALQLNEALESKKVKNIVLAIDSPGGEAAGCELMAQMIHESLGKKPIVAFTDGYAASAAYFLACAADYVVASPSAELGSIGTVYGMVDDSKMLERMGLERIEIVSVQSPKKRFNLSDPKSRKEGLNDIQIRANDMAQIFVDAVAEYRGVSAETVLSDFGQGGVMIASKAVEAGMADAVMSYEELHALLVDGGLPQRSPRLQKANKTQGVFNMDIQHHLRAISNALGVTSDAPQTTEDEPQVEDEPVVEDDGVPAIEPGTEEEETPAAAALRMENERLRAQLQLLQGSAIDPATAREQELQEFMSIAGSKVTPAMRDLTENLFVLAQEGKLNMDDLRGYFNAMPDHGSLQRIQVRPSATKPVSQPKDIDKAAVESDNKFVQSVNEEGKAALASVLNGSNGHA